MAYPKEISQHCGQILSERREKAQLELLARRESIAREHPEIITLEHELATTSARLAAAFLSRENVDEKIAEIKKYNLAKQLELENALTAAGYQKDALEAHHECPLCNDTGSANGRLCRCGKELQRQLMYKRLGALSATETCSFNNFSISFYSDEIAPEFGVSERMVMKKALSECIKYAEEFSAASANLLLYGAPGLGKTHLSLAIARTVIERGFDVLYLPFHLLLSRLEKAKFSYGAQEAEDYITPVLNCELLVLDDLGSEFFTSFSSSSLYNIINTRLLDGKPTIINTNLTESELAQRYGERIHSRLIGGYRIIPFVGNDIRLQKNIFSK